MKLAKYNDASGTLMFSVDAGEKAEIDKEFPNVKRWTVALKPDDSNKLILNRTIYVLPAKPDESGYRWSYAGTKKENAVIRFPIGSYEWIGKIPTFRSSPITGIVAAKFGRIELLFPEKLRPIIVRNVPIHRTRSTETVEQNVRAKALPDKRAHARALVGPSPEQFAEFKRAVEMVNRLQRVVNADLEIAHGKLVAHVHITRTVNIT